MIAVQAKRMAAYNRWMNEQLYGACDELSDEERKRNRRAFFHSIHGTLNHLLLADRIWLGRFTGEPYSAKRLDETLHESYPALRAERAAVDRTIEQWAAGLCDADLLEPLHYTSLLSPGPKQCPLWVAVAHFFNHQTHHRGQLTALLSQCGVDYGVTDLIGMPESVSASDG